MHYILTLVIEFLEIQPNDNFCRIVVPRHQPLMIASSNQSEMFIEIQLALFEKALQGELLLIED